MRTDVVEAKGTSDRFAFATPRPWRSAYLYDGWEILGANDEHVYQMSGRGDDQDEWWQSVIADTELIVTAVNERDALRHALVLAAVPLEVLNADNGLGAKWMSEQMVVAVADAVKAIRAVVATTVIGTTGK